MLFPTFFLVWLLILDCRISANLDGIPYQIVQLVSDVRTVLFPHVKISMHLCQLDKDATIALSRIMSRYRFVHEIYVDIEGFETRGNDIWDHRILYALDLKCDYAGQLLRMANASGMFSAPIRWLTFQDKILSPKHLTNDSQPSFDELIEMFHDMAIYPDSDVLLVRRFESDFLDVKSIYRASPDHDIVIEERGNWTSGRGFRMKTFDVASRRRRNLGRALLKSCLVMTEADTINHLTDFENRHIDPVTKSNYPWILHIVNRMNATVTFRVTNNWGYRGENGSWSGMTGMLQRREIDIGGTATFLVKERIGIVDYVQLYAHTSSRFIFRQPLLSTVSNIFTLPFQRPVWIAIGVLLLFVFILLCFSTKWEYQRGIETPSAIYWKQFNVAEQTPGDNFLVMLGAITQQGYAYEPYTVPPRIVTLMLLIAVLSLYASYTANIVALLQSTTDSIKTLDDLLNSPLKLGAQDVVYNKYFFKSFQDPVRKRIFEKIEPKKGNQKPTWMTVSEGVRCVKDQLFAFHGEKGAMYKVMQETYQEDEKCGITEINYLKMVYPLLVIQTRSPYLEIVKNSALLLRESGLKYREETRLYAKKPKCQGQTGFISIGITECYFAIVSLAYGSFFSVVVLMLELAWHKWGRSIGDDAPIDVQSVDQLTCNVREQAGSIQ